jgi:hypothetical protein
VWVFTRFNDEGYVVIFRTSCITRKVGGFRFPVSLARPTIRDHSVSQSGYSAIKVVLQNIPLDRIPAWNHGKIGE